MSTPKASKQPPLHVVGSPVSQSMSPAIFARFFAAVGANCELTPLEIQADALGAVCDRVRQSELSGFCVTAPLKQAVMEHLDLVDDTARRCGAVNWVTPSPQGLRGSNTDVDGVIKALAETGKTSATRVLILGAGGAARAAVCAATALSATHITIANRTRAKADALVDEFLAKEETRGAPSEIPPRFETSTLDADDVVFAQAFAAADVVINATSCGLNAPDADPLPSTFTFGYRHTVLDMVYRPLQTRLLVRALAEGARVADGLSMLIHQAVAGFALVQASHSRPESLPVGVSHQLHRDIATRILKEDGQLESSENNPFILAGRSRINAIDEEIIALLGNRFATARAIGEVKACLNEPVVRPGREKALRQMHKDWAEDHRSPAAVVEAVYDAVLSASRAAQSALQLTAEDQDRDVPPS